ncbi:MAG: PrgI family protein [Patescibacteria group bacterium]|nr:PrgI family protein [Patescibacteria group bacterium]
MPQFTDVEDKIIGPLTIKQFGILFAGGIFVFLGYSATKSVAVGVVFLILFGVPALGIAFAKINGRPLYTSFMFLIKFITSPKVLVFHKGYDSAMGLRQPAKGKVAEVKAEEPAKLAGPPQDPKSRLAEINSLLEKKVSEERELLKRIH